MNRLDILDLIAGGEGSGVELKRSVDDNRDLAKELVAFGNLTGGTVLVGVDDDGTVVGIGAADLETRVMQACRDKIRPPLVPYYQEVEVEPGVRVAVVRVERGYSVHGVWHNHRHTYYLRVGSTSQEASPEELARLFQQRGALRAELQPLSGATLETLDLRRLTEYFRDVRERDAPDVTARDDWERLLLNTEYLTESSQSGPPVASLAGMVLFGRELRRFAPFSAIDCAAYPDRHKTYETRDRAHLVAPLVPLGPADGRSERSVIEDALSFVMRNISVTATIEPSGQRVDRAGLPWRRYARCSSTPSSTVTTCSARPMSSWRCTPTASRWSRRGGCRTASTQTGCGKVHGRLATN